MDEDFVDSIALDILKDPGYQHVDPELRALDSFTLTSTGLLPDDDINAFVRAGLYRSFTSPKVLSLVLAHKPVSAASRS
jgi:hypothetical protein